MALISSLCFRISTPEGGREGGRSDKGDFVGRDNGPIALVLGNREQRKVVSTFLGSHQRALDLPLFPVLRTFLCSLLPKTKAIGPLSRSTKSLLSLELCVLASMIREAGGGGG